MTAIETLIGAPVLIHNTRNHEARVGQVVGPDKNGGILIRGIGRSGGEFHALPELLEQGEATNKRGHIRFELVPDKPVVPIDDLPDYIGLSDIDRPS